MGLPTCKSSSKPVASANLWSGAQAIVDGEWTEKGPERGSGILGAPEFGKASGFYSVYSSTSLEGFVVFIFVIFFFLKLWQNMCSMKSTLTIFLCKLSLTVFIVLCSHHHHPVFGTLSSCKTETLFPFTVNSPSLLPQPLASTLLPSISKNLMPVIFV